MVHITVQSFALALACSWTLASPKKNNLQKKVRVGERSLKRRNGGREEEDKGKGKRTKERKEGK